MRPAPTLREPAAKFAMTAQLLGGSPMYIPSAAAAPDAGANRQMRLRPGNLLVLAVAAVFGQMAVGQADELHPMQGGTVQLGPESASLYYTDEFDGYRVVATVAEEVGPGAALRFVATLQPGQSVTLSVARTAGEEPAEVVIRRVGDHLVYDRPNWKAPSD
jgi:hypothetical protein